MKHAVLACAALLALLTPVHAEDAPEREAPVAAPTRAAQIQWFGTWDQAKAEAARTGRAILLAAAAPHCRNISGMW